jgi:hypothetical protein
VYRFKFGQRVGHSAIEPSVGKKWDNRFCAKRRGDRNVRIIAESDVVGEPWVTEPGIVNVIRVELNLELSVAHGIIAGIHRKRNETMNNRFADTGGAGVSGTEAADMRLQIKIRLENATSISSRKICHSFARTREEIGPEIFGAPDGVLMGGRIGGIAGRFLVNAIS